MAKASTKAGTSPADDYAVEGAAVVGAYAQEAVELARRVYTVGTGEAAKTFVLMRNADGSESLKDVDPRGPHMAVAGRIVQRVTLETADSLFAYLKRFAPVKAGKEAAATIFASIAKNELVGVVDYHEPDKAGFGEHVATLTLKLSEEWKAWAAVDGKLMSQLDFVRFLDENRADIVSPDASTILELCKDMQALRKSDFRSVVRADSANYKIDYAEAVEARVKGEILVPTEFKLRLPVYFEGETHELFAMLVWKLSEKEEGNGLALGVKLKRPEKLRQAVFLDNVRKISEATGIRAMHGKRGDDRSA